MELECTKIKESELHLSDQLEQVELECRKLKEIELECRKLKISELQLSDKLEQVQLEFSDKLGQVELQLSDKLEQVELESSDKLEQVELRLSDKLEQVELEFSDKLEQVELECTKLKESELQLSNQLKEVELKCGKLKISELKLSNKLLFLFIFILVLFFFELESRKLKEVELQLSHKLEQVESVAVSHQDELSSTFFTWRIQNFHQCWQAAKRGSKEQLDSEPFYTSPHKYKMKLSLCPNGHSVGKNTHLSVYIIIMKGEYDAILPWPFLPQVTFTLIDQQEDTSQRENVVMSFKPDPTLEAFARPVGDQNVGRGYPTFMSHEQLQTRRYIVDNTIFLQVKVEVPETD